MSQMKDLGRRVDDAEADRDQRVAAAKHDPGDQQLQDELGITHCTRPFYPV